MNLKKGWIYLFRTDTAVLHEGLFAGSVNGVAVFHPLDFAASAVCPRFVEMTDIKWAVPVSNNPSTLTEMEYRAALNGVLK
jgi:hypothetical protein